MIKLVTSAEMREMDRHTIEDLGIPGIVLMENAGAGTFRVIRDLLKEYEKSVVSVFCGKGNNGGDGFVIARHLWDAGADVRIFIVGEAEGMRGDARTNFLAVKNLNIPHFFIHSISDIKKNLDAPPDLIVDALLGTGIVGEVHGFIKEVIDYINQQPGPVVAVDIPSGLNADSPLVAGSVVRADATVTMGLPKRCQAFYPAKSFVGELFIADIGIPHYVRNSGTVKVQIVEKEDIRLPFREPDAHKYACGKVGVLAGSPGYTGAAALSAEAALKIGAGLVILAVPEELNPILEAKLTEVITRPYATREKAHLVRESLPGLADFLEWCNVLAIGPGLGRSRETQAAILQILKDFSKPAVIDADALFALANQPELLNTPHPNWVLTPHFGEFSRFFPKLKKTELQANLIEIAQEFASTRQINLLLKGAPSLVVNTDGEVFVNSTGNAGLASGGTGDVLTGFVAGLAAQGPDLDLAAITANYLHGLCADVFSEKETAYTLTAGELLKNLGVVLREHFFSGE